MKYKISSHIKELLSFRITKVALLLIIFAIAIQTDAKPALSPEKPAVTEWVQPIERPLHFELTNTGEAKGITLAPFYEVNHSYYNIHWDVEEIE